MGYTRFFLYGRVFLLFHFGWCLFIVHCRSVLICIYFFSQCFGPTPFIQPSPVLDQIVKLGQALRKRIVIGPAKRLVKNQIRVGKHFGIEQARFRLAKEPVIVGEQCGERAQGVSGVDEELVRIDEAAAGGFEDLVGGGVAEGVEGGEVEDGRGGKVEGFEEGCVCLVEVEGVELFRTG